MIPENNGSIAYPEEEHHFTRIIRVLGFTPGILDYVIRPKTIYIGTIPLSIKKYRNQGTLAPSEYVKGGKCQ